MIGNEGTPGSPAEHTAHLAQSSGLSGLVLEVIEGPMDGVVFADDVELARLGRNLDNSVSLHADLYVSGFHLLCRRGAGPRVWILEDQGSSNGTFIEGGQLNAPHPVQLGSTFVVGHLSVVRCRARQGEATRAISPESLYKGKTQLYENFSPDLQQAFGAAAMLASQERRGFVNDRHLFLGLAMNQADLPLFLHGKGPIPHEFLDHVLRRPEDWNGIEPWVGEHLKARLFNNFFSADLPWSPRVVWSLQAAEAEAKRRGTTVIEPIDWCRAVLSDPGCRTFQVLERHGLEPGRLAEHLIGVAVEPEVRQRAPKGTQAFQPSLFEGTRPRPLVVSSGSNDVDNKAQQLARRLDGLTAYYFLAEPEDRRQAMQNVLRQELRQLESAQRRPLLEQLQRLFPLDAGSPQQVQEVERLNNKIQQLEHRIGELEKQQGPSTSGVPWHLVVERKLPEGTLDTLSPVDRPRIEFLREVFGFSINVERFIIGLALGLTTTGGGVTGSLALPGHRMSIKAYLNDLGSGRQVKSADLTSYLQDIELWLLAGISAYSEGPKVWFKDFWEKASPTVIERSFSGWTRTVGLQHRELWQRYKDVTRHLNPDLVSQKIFHETKRITLERRQQLAERRTSS